MYGWLVALHLVGLAVFLLAHGVSIWVAFRVRRERDARVVAALLGLSAHGARVVYLGLALLGAGGLGAAAVAGSLTRPWNVASYVILAVVLVAMFAVAAPYYHGLRAALEGSGGEPPLDGDALSARLRTRRPEVLAAIGGSGIVVLLLLMVLKPA